MACHELKVTDFLVAVQVADKCLLKWHTGDSAAFEFASQAFGSAAMQSPAPRLNGPSSQWFLAICISVCSLLSLTQGQQLLTSGRVSDSMDSGFASLPLTLSWPATSVHAKFQDSNSVTVNFQAGSDSGSATNNSFRFELDGVQYQQYIGLSGSWQHDGLSSGSHDLVVTKLTEAVYGVAVVSSITLESSGRYFS